MNIDGKHIFEEFKSMFPLIAGRALDWKPNGQLEIIVQLDDDTKIIYDSISHSIITIKSEDEQEDESWQREFSRRLEKRIILKGITQQELSERTCISRQSINKYINGTASPTLTNIIKISRVLNCPLSELIDID